jgi:hypothetical protein
MINPAIENQVLITRRQFFGRASNGLGVAALASLLGDDLFGSSKGGERNASGLPGLPHFSPRAKRVIYLTQSGAPSQIDLFDYKPNLIDKRGKELPSSVHMGQRLTTMTAGQKMAVQPTKFMFSRHGQAGTWLSELLPYTASVVDDICIIKSMQTDAINHAPGMTLFLCGAEQPGRPSTGAWVSYGLGSVSRDLPAFVVLMSRDRHGTCGQLLFDYYWGSGFLPSKFQGVKFRAGADPVLYLSDPPGFSRQLRREFLDDLAQLNELKQSQIGDPEITARIAQYEMAYRMQTSVPELTDFSKEPPQVLDLYGPDVRKPGTYAWNCLLARRMAERGVRFIQLFHVGWDTHRNLEREIRMQCEDTDQASAALVTDLKQRGMLDDTLIVWGGEFGRTVFSQGDLNASDYGRDHHPRCFAVWMAGGGVKPGMTFGATDDYSYNVIESPVHVHDLQATVLHQLGIDHEKLTFKHQGRNFRLTDISGNVVKQILS